MCGDPLSGHSLHSSRREKRLEGAHWDNGLRVKGKVRWCCSVAIGGVQMEPGRLVLG